MSTQIPLRIPGDDDVGTWEKALSKLGFSSFKKIGVPQ